MDETCIKSEEVTREAAEDQDPTKANDIQVTNSCVLEKIPQKDNNPKESEEKKYPNTAKCYEFSE